MQFKVEWNLRLERRRPKLTNFPFSSILEKWEVAPAPSEVSPQSYTPGKPSPHEAISHVFPDHSSTSTHPGVLAASVNLQATPSFWYTFSLAYSSQG